MIYQWDENNPLGYNNKLGKYKTNKELGFILSCINSHNLKILDIAGGSGRFAVPLQKKGHDITLIDMNQEAVNLAKKRGIEKSYCINLNEFNSSGFDLAIAIEIFGFTSPPEVLLKAQRFLVSGGLLIFTATNSKSWRSKIRSMRQDKSRYHTGMAFGEYKALIESYGFEVVKTEGFYWMPFKVNSDNLLIPFFTKLEKLLRLNKYIGQSPWLLFACKKK